jgi:hypothetical protein
MTSFARSTALVDFWRGYVSNLHFEARNCILIEPGIFILVQKSQQCQKRKYLLDGTLKMVYQIYHPESKFWALNNWTKEIWEFPKKK